MNILLSGEFEAAELHVWQQCLHAALPDARWLDRAQALAVADTVQVAVVANPPPGSLRGLPQLRLIQSLWAGVDRLLLDPTLPQGVPIARMVDPAMNASMAETALWATLALHRGYFDYARSQRQGLWQPRPQRRADSVRVLVLGLGQMGLTSARRIAQQGYRVSGWSQRARVPSADLDGIAVHAGVAALPALLAASDIVVNLARGAHVVDADLLAALDRGHLAHAVLDVFHTEPLPAGHAYWSHPRVSLLPHVAAQTDPASASQVVADNVRALLAGRPLAHLVDGARGY